MTARISFPAALALAAACVLAGCTSSLPSFPVAGEPCDPTGPDRCRDSFCLRLDEGGVCSVPCADDFDCPGGLTCQVDGRLEALVCKPGVRCTTDDGCPSGHRCDASRGSCYIPVRRGLCAPCTADSQCPSGGSCLRALGSGERFCTAPCTPGCPDGYRCRTIPPTRVGEQETRQCVPESETCHAGRPLCAPCSGDAECADGTARCVENLLTGERFCGIACSPTCTWSEARQDWIDSTTDAPCRSGCPRNFTCTRISDPSGEVFQCVPNALTCSGWCEPGDLRSDLAQCGPGATCVGNECRIADDGRACAPCTDDDQCNVGGLTGGLCLANVQSGETFCAPACEDLADCASRWGAGFDCLLVDGDRVCVPLQATCVRAGRGLGSDCSVGGPADCLSGICVHYGERGLCSAPCEADAECGDARQRCCAVVPTEDGATIDCDRPSGPAGGVCVPREGEFGDDCDPGRAPCHDGFCLDIGTARLCTAACVDDASCDEASGTSGGFECRQARAVDGGGAPGELVNVCFPSGGGAIGSDCTFGPAACADRLCIKKESGNVCTRSCAEDDCPPGWRCGDTRTVDDRPVRVCLPG
ncbi:MAG TPA: hypothetical protein VN033_07655 [Vulgatibacter sp.]|nr:hypothetical protein [Vulgatibacter sp.]